MSHQQYANTVAQWAEMERAGQEEAEWRRLEDGNLALQEAAEIRQREEDEYIASLQAKYPQMLAFWPERKTS